MDDRTLTSADSPSAVSASPWADVAFRDCFSHICSVIEAIIRYQYMSSVATVGDDNIILPWAGFRNTWLTMRVVCRQWRAWLSDQGHKVLLHKYINDFAVRPLSGRSALMIWNSLGIVVRGQDVSIYIKDYRHDFISNIDDPIISVQFSIRNNEIGIRTSLYNRKYNRVLNSDLRAKNDLDTCNICRCESDIIFILRDILAHAGYPNILIDVHINTHHTIFNHQFIVIRKVDSSPAYNSLWSGLTALINDIKRKYH